MGVRNSWLILAMNSLLAWLADSAMSLAMYQFLLHLFALDGRGQGGGKRLQNAEFGDRPFAFPGAVAESYKSPEIMHGENRQHGSCFYASFFIK